MSLDQVDTDLAHYPFVHSSCLLRDNIPFETCVQPTANPLYWGLRKAHEGFRVRTLIITLILGCASPNLPALDPQKTLAQYTRSTWTQAQGLPQNQINAITQTTDGNLWISTNEGLSRFDGYEFTNFSEDDGTLPTNSVGALVAGRDGTLWVGTRYGLLRYRNGQFTTFTTANGLPDNFISALVEDHTGALWIAAGAFLSRFADEKFTNYSPDMLLPVRGARKLYEDSRHNLWVAGVGGVVKVTSRGFEKVLGPKEMEDQIVDAFNADDEGDLWIGGPKGIILRTPDGKLRRFDSHNGLPDNLVLALWKDRDGNMWAGTNNGLSRFEGDRFLTFDLEDANSRDIVRSVFEDREGDLWLGREGGLTEFRDSPFTIFAHTEGFPREIPVAIHQDRKGTVWIGYHGGGMVAMEAGQVRTYTTKDGLASNEIYAIQERSNGDLLIANRQGLGIRHAGRFSNYRVPDPLGRTILFDVLEDKAGRVWGAGRGGVFELTGDKLRVVVPGGPLLNEPAVVLANGLDGSVWAGFYGGGLWQIQNGKSRHWDTNAGLSSDTIRCLLQDADGTLWIGTLGGGLNAFKNGVFTRYLAKDGLLSNNVFHIEDDGHGFLWLSTSRGICQIAKQQLRDQSSKLSYSLTPANFGVADGLRSAEVAPGYPGGGGGIRSSDGRLWFPTTEGVAVLEPTAGKKRLTTPLAISLVEVTVDGRRINLSQPQRLNSGPREIQFRYTSIHFSGPDRVRYEYRLEGLDPDWIPAGTRRSTSYIGLPHGKYRFLVRASVPGEPPSLASFGLEVLPHFYERPLFGCLCCVSLLAAVFGIYQLRSRQLRREFALVFDERTRLAREIHDTLSQGFVGISSQLNAVATRIRTYRSSHDADENLKVADEHLQLARKMARHSLTEARRSVMDLRAAILDNRDLPSALAAGASEWSVGTDTSISVEVSGAPYTFSQDLEQNILRIAQEAALNAIKHGAATAIQIHLEMKPERLVLTVCDNGRGFDASQAFSLAGEHFGLQGMRERAERFGGKFRVSSQPSNGTEVTVTIPVRSDAVRRRLGFPRWKIPFGFQFRARRSHD